MDISKTASRIMDSTKLGNRVIFNVNGEIKTLDWNSDKGKKMFADFPEICMGIYDARCNRDWILEDLK